MKTLPALLVMPVPSELPSSLIPALDNAGLKTMNKQTTAVAGVFILVFAGYLILRPASETPPSGKIAVSEAAQSPPAAPVAKSSAPPPPPSPSPPQRRTAAPYVPPPDPGPEGRATVLGVDRNTNGVRDDVERWIVQQVPDSPRKREALFQYARTYTSALQMKEKSEVPEASRQSLAALGCMSFVFGKDPRNYEKRLESVTKIESMHMNTPERLTAMQKVQDLYAGYIDTVPDGDDGKTCSFELDEYPE